MTTVELEDVVTFPLLPKQCFSAARFHCENGTAKSYLEGVLFLSGIPFPIGHAVYRAHDGTLHDDARTGEAGDLYLRFVEVPAEAFRAAMQNPLFVREFERHDMYPFIISSVEQPNSL